MKCCKCDKVALRRAKGKGYCKEHYNLAFQAARQEVAERDAAVIANNEWNLDIANYRKPRFRRKPI